MAEKESAKYLAASRKLRLESYIRCSIRLRHKADEAELQETGARLITKRYSLEVIPDLIVNDNDHATTMTVTLGPKGTRKLEQSAKDQHESLSQYARSAVKLDNFVFANVGKSQEYINFVRDREPSFSIPCADIGY